MPSKPNYLIFENRKKLFDEVSVKNKPKAGTFYTVPKGAWIDTISLKTYGRDRNADIIKANEQLLKDRPIEPVTQLPYIHPGDVLWLPVDDLDTQEDETIPADSPDEIAYRVNGKIFKGWTSTSIERSMNNIADSFSFTAPFNPDDPDSDYLQPFTYLETDLFIGGNIYIYGRSEGWNPTLNLDSTMMSVSCRSRTGVIIDCTSQEKSLNFNKQTLSQISDKLLKPFGLKSDFPFGDSDIIVKTKRNITDKIYGYLQGLAKKKGFIINSNRKDGIKYDKANIEGEPILNLVQGEQPLTGSISATYDGTKRFSDYIAVSQSNGNPGNNSTAKDTSIPISRPLIFSAKDTKQGDIKTAAEWERNRALGKSMGLTVKVGTWFDKNDNLIYENEIVTLKAPNVCIYEETKFLIEKVSLSKTESGGKEATLTLVLPETYSSEFPEVFPWQR
jgi:prophage tail gpP-like protein